MDQFNKVLSFVLGLVVVAVFIVIASGKFNFKGLGIPKSNTASTISPSVTPIITPKPTSKPWFSFFSKPEPTSKPVIAQKITPAEYKSNSTQQQQQQTQQDPNYHTYSSSPVPNSIPNTGIPIVLFPLLGTSFLTGIFMKKTGKKN